MCEIGNVEYIRTATAAEAHTLVADWAKGETVFLQFTVQDTGRGLSNDEKDLLFARFSQASPRTHIRYGGSGLGLFISRRLTEMQGGAIGFSSQTKVSDGVTPPSPFYQSDTPDPTPPLSPVRARSGSFDDQQGGSPAKRPSLVRKASAVSDPLHVLLVEDNLINQRVLANQLHSRGCIVTVANHGVEALEHLRKTTYAASSRGIDSSPDTESMSPKSFMSAAATPAPLDVILMDWEMPIMDGLSAVREIRRMEREGVLVGHVPVIAVTANVRGEQITKAMDAGMDDVVSKPFRVPELCSRMRDLILRLSS
ncbi:putative hsp90-like protein [Neofusicoccum parvum UCRNP2]|uniref:Putative hsp90-like protein n=1 Tax=Botryosphaeria parva (strain UCR-NP2) TaxID=1287680 RepID=R1EJ64_BOTPV|nr:putative hsp90-like protein [Neofusicoccum parvum UCRNP2]